MSEFKNPRTQLSYYLIEPIKSLHILFTFGSDIKFSLRFQKINIPKYD